MHTTYCIKRNPNGLKKPRCYIQSFRIIKYCLGHRYVFKKNFFFMLSPVISKNTGGKTAAQDLLARVTLRSFLKTLATV